MLRRVDDILIVYSVRHVVKMSHRQEGDFRCVGYERMLQMGSKDESMVSEQYETDRGCL